MKLKLMTFNLRCGNDPNGHSVAERAPRLFKVLEEYRPDIMGFQECTPQWEQELQAITDKYSYIWMYRHVNSPEAAPVFWNKDLFELVNEDHFWLSDTPNIPSRGWGADHYRICSFAALRHKQTGKILNIFNTHVDWGGSSPRESGQLIIRRAEALGNEAAVFCTADYNFAPNSSGWHSMRSYFKDVREEIAPNNNRATLHGYEDRGDRISWIIDFCFFRGKGVTPTKYEVVTRTYEGKFPSDHYGVYFEFDIET